MINKWLIANRETGDVIEVENSLAEAEKTLADYEQSDKSEGIYVPEFYEISKGEAF